MVSEIDQFVAFVATSYLNAGCAIVAFCVPI